jgi:hypothetical protein
VHTAFQFNNKMKRYNWFKLAIYKLSFFLASHCFEH